jgi:post-segregation antitoxin (ccd killing protein)
VAVTKLSVSVDDEIAETVKQAAHDEGVTVSAWLSAAATARIRNRLLGEAIAEAACELASFDDETIEALTTAARSRAVFTGSPSAG